MELFEKIMKYRNDTNEFATNLGIRTTEMTFGYAKGEMNIRDQFMNAIGSVHGGCIFTLADTTGGAAAASYGYRVTTISSDFHFLSPAINVKKIYAVAKEIKRGKKISVIDVEIFNDEDKLIAKGIFSFFNLEIPVIEE